MRDLLEQIAARHGVSVEAAETLAHALAATGGKSAQFNHPELGGMGQWMPGMVMIGDMFNTRLKARVDALATEIVALLPQISMAKTGKAGLESAFAWGSRAVWWPEALGGPTLSGAQNDTAYAYFPAHHRLALKQGGKVTIYDTTGYEIRGSVQAAQNNLLVWMFQTDRGPVEVSAFRLVEVLT